MKADIPLPNALRPLAAMVAAALAAWSPGHAQTTFQTVSNPHWNITLSDYGYSDFLLDNTPGFEGREYLSGEWGAAIGYQVSDGPGVTAQWLEPQFSYPNWTTNSTFTVVTPLTQPILNADNLPITQSVIKNAHLEITQRFEMLDTVTGTPMGTSPASASGSGTFNHSNRYVMKHTYTVKNIAGVAISNVQLFQLLHGLNSQRGVYDNRSYPGTLSNFQYDTTLAGVDQWAVGAGAGLEDFISFHATSAPTAQEIGYYGIEGNGVDDHGMGKPSVGTHLSIEANALNGMDHFAPPIRWVAGAQRWTLGNLAVDQSVSFDVLLSILTGTKVPAGSGSTGSCDGGSSVPGGIDYTFESVETEGTCFSDFSRADQNELATRIAAGEFNSFTFPTPGAPAQVWEVAFSGAYSGAVDLTLSYDSTLLPAGFDESTLAIHHFSGGAWHTLPGTVDPLTHKIACSTTTLGPFVLGVDGGTLFQVDASESPANSGTVTGAGAYAQASGVTLVAAATPSYVFVNWTEGASVVSSSPAYSFAAQADRTLVANFVPVGSAKKISTSSSPSSAGSTTGDGAYALTSSATVVATANPGYKFSKWTVNGVKVNGAGSNYTFTVAADRALVAVFKPVYTVSVTCDPEAIDGDAFEAAADTKPPAGYEPGDKVVMEISHTVPGYSFVNWTDNGVPVSTLAGFTFNATGNRQLVAHFALGDRIDLLADPKTAGNVSGAGVFQSGTEVTVSAEARPGYIFLGWTENDVYVSDDADYAFTAGGVARLLTAIFVALPELTIAPAATPGQLEFTWPDAPGWVLQESGSLATWDTTTRDITTSNGQRSVTVDPTEGHVFFRLAHP